MVSWHDLLSHASFYLTGMCGKMVGDFSEISAGEPSIFFFNDCGHDFVKR